MATKTKKVTKASTSSATKVKATKSNVAKKVNTSLVNASLSAINTTLDNGEKWQKLASKLIKKSENVRKQQINMIFDTAEAVKGQFITGTDKMKDLVGYDDALLEETKNRVMNNPISKKVIGIVEDITEKVTTNPTVQKAEKATEDMKKKGMSKYNELKGDVLNQAYKIVNTAENKLEDARKDLKKEANKATKAAAKTNPKNTTAAIKAKGAAKVKQVKATTAAKKKTAKAAVKAKVATKASTSSTKKTSAAKTKKVVAKKVSEIETKGKAEVKAVKAAVKETIKTSAKDDLKLIYGIGPKTEIALNNNGVNTFADYAKLETTQVEEILEKETIVFASTDLKDWKKQAEVAVKDGAEGLVKWVERYRTA